MHHPSRELTEITEELSLLTGGRLLRLFGYFSAPSSFDTSETLMLPLDKSDCCEWSRCSSRGRIEDCKLGVPTDLKLGVLSDTLRLSRLSRRLALSFSLISAIAAIDSATLFSSTESSSSFALAPFTLLCKPVLTETSLVNKTSPTVPCCCGGCCGCFGSCC